VDRNTSVLLLRNCSQRTVITSRNRHCQTVAQVTNTALIHTLGKCKGVLSLSLGGGGGGLAGGRFPSGRTSYRLSRQRFSWFSSVFKLVLRWLLNIPSCYCMLLVQPQRFKFIIVVVSPCFRVNDNYIYF